MPSIKDETGHKYGRLLVLYMTPRKGKEPIKWHCKCDCGNEVDVLGTSLRNGNTRSCGCLHKEQLAARNAANSSVHVGQTYGELTIIQDLGMRKQKSRDKNERWSLCQCSCGKQIEVPNNMLQNGWKKSCGCIATSWGEHIIEQLLIEHNIEYSKEYTFSDLYNKDINAKLRFDFAIFKDKKLQYLIEFDGKQHYIDNDCGWDDSLENIQKRDSLKNQYCLTHHIPLIRIPYTKYRTLNINDLKLETSNFIITAGEDNGDS